MFIHRANSGLNMLAYAVFFCPHLPCAAFIDQDLEQVFKLEIT